MTTANVNEREAYRERVTPDEPKPIEPRSPSQMFDYAMLRVVMLDLNEPGSGCMPFILATADLSLEARRDLLLKASAALLNYCDDHGAAECLKYALGVEHLKPSDELDQAIEAGLQIIAEAAEDERENDDPWELIRIIEEAHQSPTT